MYLLISTWWLAAVIADAGAGPDSASNRDLADGSADDEEQHIADNSNQELVVKEVPSREEAGGEGGAGEAEEADGGRG